jgi:hypothetical protein
VARMSKEILSRTIYVHQIANPPVTGRSIQAKINFINLKQFEISDSKDETGQPHFTLKIIDPKKIGLENSEQSDIEKFVDKILLACNLTLNRASFSTHIADASDTKIEFQDSNAGSPQPEVTKTSQGFRVDIHEAPIRIRDSVHITVGFRDVLDESKVLEIIKKVDSLDNLRGRAKFQVPDIGKSLTEYSAAMSIFDRGGIFKHLFSSLELATNCDGNDRIGQSLDAEVSKIAAISTTEVEDWREFNNRAKHIDRNQQHEKLHKNGLLKLGEKLDPLRQACQKIILDRLCNISR